MIIKGTQEAETNAEDKTKFMCGVVEGFYGRPWTSEQRRRLFQRMNKMGMDTYLYAPKDDCKHRMYWRDLYTVEEADHLTSLIAAASEENITFVYALSPGLDMTYSSAKEITCLKRKLEQVSSFGCKAFALLFDDIEVDMSEADKEIFQSFAQAHVSVTNEVYQHLGQPEKFLFCPTEYCATRAVPSVTRSEYLATIGSRLLYGIDVMWTGPKVVSKRITIRSVEEISRVLHRPPVIWDNIHANDYDQRRLFLGPYDGRSSELIPYIRGVLTNPNCEFEANFIAMHTLAQWSKSNLGGMKKDFILSESPVSEDIKLETEGEYKVDEDVPFNCSSYQPKVALTDAIRDWLEVFYHECGPTTQKLVPMLPVSMPVDIKKPAAYSCSDASNMNAPLQNDLNNVSDSFMQPTTINPVNSLLDSSSYESDDDPGIIPEPMDCAVSTSGASSCSTTDSSISVTSKPRPDDGASVSSECHCPSTPKTADLIETMQVDSETNVFDRCAEIVNGSDVQSPVPFCSHLKACSELQLSERDVQDIIEMFYMPFEHGTGGVSLLNEFHWLKVWARDMCEGKNVRDLSPLYEEWHRRADAFCQRLEDLYRVFCKFCHIPNKALLYDMFPYIWDMAVVMNQLHTFVAWLGSNVIFREHFSRGDQEPWVFRGGLQAEFQDGAICCDEMCECRSHLSLAVLNAVVAKLDRKPPAMNSSQLLRPVQVLWSRMLPLEGAVDLLLMACPALPELKLSRVRPYTNADEEAVYEICRKTCDDGIDGTEIFPGQPDLISDKLVGAFLTLSPEYCFVIEDDAGVYGYVLSAVNVADFAFKVDVAWLPAMREKYPKPDKTDNLTPAEEIVASFYSPTSTLPSGLCVSHPAVIRMDLLPNHGHDTTIAKRAMASVIATLKVSGAHGIHTEIHIGDQNTVDFYTRLGFIEIQLPDTPDDLMYMGRMI